MKTEQVAQLLDNPMSYLTELSLDELSALQWYIKMIRKKYNAKGYFLSTDTYRELNFPDVEMFDTERHPLDGVDEELAKLYRSFSWKSFLAYCQPVVDTQDNRLLGFSYKGNLKLDTTITKYMLRFPSVDWVNSTLLMSDVQMDDDLRKLIADNRVGYARDVHCDFKCQQSRFYAALYLLDRMAFIMKTFDEDFNMEVHWCTRCPELIKVFVPTQADELIAELDNDSDFDMPVSGIVKCVRFDATLASGSGIDYVGETVDLNMADSFTMFLPYVAFKAYTDGFSERINDMPEKAALLTLDFKKTGRSERYCTLNQQVFRSVFAEVDKLRVNSRARFTCGLDVYDFSFKYWNLQSSIEAERVYSAFSPFSLRGIGTFDLSKLSKEVLSSNYKQAVKAFKDKIHACNDAELKLLAIACGISPSRPALSLLLEDFVESKHPTELIKIMSSNAKLFSL